MAHHAELDDELVDELLSKAFVDEAVLKVVLDVDVEERRHVAQRHGGPVLLLDRGKVGHVDPLHGLLCRIGRAGEVEPVIFAHHFDVFQGSDLFGHLFAQADAVLGHGAGEVAQVVGLGLNDAVDAVEGQATVVADDAAAGIVVGQARQEAQRAEFAYFFGIDVEHAVVVGLTVVGEDFLYLGVELYAVLGAGFLNDAYAAEGLDGTFQQHVGLQAHDELVLAVDVACGMRGDGRDAVGVERTNATPGAFLFEGFQTFFPHGQGAGGGALQERGVTFVGRDVSAHKVGDVDFAAPWPVDELLGQIHKLNINNV